MHLALTGIPLPLRLRTDTPLSDLELERFSSDNNPMRIEREPNGELTVVSPTGSEGGSQELTIAAYLMFWANQDGRGKAFGPNAGFKLPDTSIRAADAAWVSLRRWNALTPEQRKGFAPLCPEFVIELRSHSDRLRPLRTKIEQWIANGAELAWLIDPYGGLCTNAAQAAYPNIVGIAQGGGRCLTAIADEPRKSGRPSADCLIVRREISGRDEVSVRRATSNVRIGNKPSKLS